MAIIRQIARNFVFPMATMVGAEKLLRGKHSMLNIMYHGVSEKPEPHCITKDIFERQIKYISENFCVFRTSEASEMYHHSGCKPEGRSLTISFDDGYRNNLNIALPILEKYNIPATFFIPTSDDVNYAGKMGKTEISLLNNHSLAEIGSHGHFHINYNGVPLVRVKHDMKISKEILEEITGKEINKIAFPFGYYDNPIKVEAKEMGYKCLFAIDYVCWNDPYDFYLLPRHGVSGTTNYHSTIVFLNKAFRKKGFL